MFHLKYFFICILCSVSLNAFSQSQSAGDSSSFGYVKKWEFSGSVSQLSFDSDAALEQGVDNSAFSLGFSADYDARRWLTSLGLDIVFYDDDNTFSVETENVFTGREQDSSSSASGGLFSVGFGPKWNIGSDARAFVSLQGGFAIMTFSDRSVGYCSDCPSEDIDLNGGAFVKALALKNVGNNSALGLQYTQFLSGDDIENSVGFMLSSAY